MDGAYNPRWIYRSSRTAPPPRCPPAAHWNNPVPFRSSLSLHSLPLFGIHRRRTPDSLLLSLSPTAFLPSISSVRHRGLSFALSIVFHSPSRSLPADSSSTLQQRNLSLFPSPAPFSLGIGFVAPRVCLRPAEDCSRLLVLLFRPAPISLSFPLRHPAFREQGHPFPSPSSTVRRSAFSTLCFPLVYFRSFSLPLSPTSLISLPARETDPTFSLSPIEGGSPPARSAPRPRHPALLSFAPTDIRGGPPQFQPRRNRSSNVSLRLAPRRIAALNSSLFHSPRHPCFPPLSLPRTRIHDGGE